MQIIKKISIILLLLVFLFAGIPPRSAQAAGLYYVAPSPSGAGDCSSWANACDLQTALTTALPYSAIWVKEGVHKPTATIARNISFVITWDNIFVHGGFNGTETSYSQRDWVNNKTILSGDIGVEGVDTDNSYRVLSIYGRDAVINGFTITKGYNDNNAIGGGIYLHSDAYDVTLKNLIITKNYAVQLYTSFPPTESWGGGIYNLGDNNLIENVTFSENEATRGAGMYNDDNSSVTIQNCTFYNNQASFAGGGLYNYQSSPTVTNVTFHANSAGTHGGGMANFLDSNPRITHVTFSNNSAGYSGGGMVNYEANPWTANSIFWGNTAPTGAQVDTVHTDPSSYGDPPLIQSLVQGGCPAGNGCSNIVTGNPLFGTLNNYGGDTDTLPLLPGSAAIDTVSSFCESSDQRYISRPRGSSCDMGSFEYAPLPIITSTASDPTNLNPIPIQITFPESMTGFDVGDISVGNGTAGNFSGSGDTYTADITPTTYGEITVDVAEGAAQNAGGTTNLAAEQFTIEYIDNVVPTLSISSTLTGPTNTSPIPVTFTFSETVTGFEVTDITVSNGTAGNFSGSGDTYTADISPTSTGTVTVDVAANVAQDASGNDNTAATQFSIVYDNTAPTLGITSTLTSPTNTSPIPVTFTFSETVTGFDVTDIAVGNGSADNFAGSGDTYTVDISPTSNGTVTVDVAANEAQDASGNDNTAAAQFSIVYDIDAPTLGISSTLTSPTDTSPIPITFTFSETVTGFDVTDIAVGNGSADNFAGSGDTYTADITPIAGGTVTVDVAANKAQDASGNDNTAAAQFSIVYDIESPVLTSITRFTPSSSPTNADVLVFQIAFSEDVQNVDAADFEIDGSTTATVTNVVSVSDSVYQLTVSGGDLPDFNGSIGLNLDLAQNITDLATNTLTNAEPATDETFLVDNQIISVAYLSVNPLMVTTFNTLEIGFNKNVLDLPGHNQQDDVTNPANYLLLQAGINKVYDTIDCDHGVDGDDIPFTINDVDYNGLSFIATLDINNGLNLRNGQYRLHVCGTTSIVDEAGNILGNGLADSITNFTISVPDALPATGFAPGQVTALPTQPANKHYSALGDLWLEIPDLGTQAAIGGVPQTTGTWDVSWLGSDIGWLTGTAFPGWAGNTVLTGHNFDASGQPGPFAELKGLKYGAQFQIHAWGQTYTYEVRENKLVTSRNVDAVLAPEEYDWVTLLTCEFYNPITDEYLSRRMVRAVLVNVE